MCELVLRDAETGEGIMMTSGAGAEHTFQCNVSQYAEHVLHRAHHQHELVEEEHHLNVYMDIAHMGVGGHDGWSPSVEPEHVVEPRRFTWSMAIKPSQRTRREGRTNGPC